MESERAITRSLSRGSKPANTLTSCGQLPVPTLTDESLLRLDHIQPIGRHADSYKATDYNLSFDALKILDEWQVWLQTGLLSEDGVLHMFGSWPAWLMPFAATSPSAIAGGRNYSLC